MPGGRSSTPTATSTRTGSTTTPARRSAAARLAGVERILVPGWNVASSERALACVDRFAGLDAAVGIHPHDAAKVDDAGWDRIVGWAPDPRVVAIGETGLDYDRVFSPIADQLTNLRRNLALALDTGKPAILHCRSSAGRRDAQDALVAELRAAGRRRPGLGRGLRRPAAGGDPLVLRSGRLRRGGRRPRAGGQLLGARLPGRGGGIGDGRARSCRPIGCSSRPIRRSSPHPAHRARATNPSGSASQGRGWRIDAGRHRRPSGRSSSPPMTGRSQAPGGPHDTRPTRLRDPSSLAAPGPRRRDRGPRRRARGCLRGVGPEPLAQRERPECHGLRIRHASHVRPADRVVDARRERSERVG